MGSLAIEVRSTTIVENCKLILANKFLDDSIWYKTSKPFHIFRSIHTRIVPNYKFRFELIRHGFQQQNPSKDQHGCENWYEPAWTEGREHEALD